MLHLGTNNLNKLIYMLLDTFKIQTLMNKQQQNLTLSKTMSDTLPEEHRYCFISAV